MNGFLRNIICQSAAGIANDECWLLLLLLLKLLLLLLLRTVAITITVSRIPLAIRAPTLTPESLRDHW